MSEHTTESNKDDLADLDDRPAPYGVAWPDDGEAHTDSLPPSPDAVSTPGDETGDDGTSVPGEVTAEMALYGFVGVLVAAIVAYQMYLTGTVDSIFQVLILVYVVGVLTRLVGLDVALDVLAESRGWQKANSADDSGTEHYPDGYADHSTSPYSPSEGVESVYRPRSDDRDSGG